MTRRPFEIGVKERAIIFRRQYLSHMGWCYPCELWRDFTVGNREFKQPEQGNLHSMVDEREALQCETPDGAQGTPLTRAHRGGHL